MHKANASQLSEQSWKFGIYVYHTFRTLSSCTCTGIYTNIYTTIRLVISVMKQTCVSQPSVFTFLLTLPVVSVLWHLFFVNDYGH